MSDHLILENDLHAAWKYAIRALNYCENASMKDSVTTMSGIVIKLSQQLEYVESHNQEVRILCRRMEQDPPQESPA